MIHSLWLYHEISRQWDSRLSLGVFTHFASEEEHIRLQWFMEEGIHDTRHSTLIPPKHTSPEPSVENTVHGQQWAETDCFHLLLVFLTVLLYLLPIRLDLLSQIQTMWHPEMLTGPAS